MNVNKNLGVLCGLVLFGGITLNALAEQGLGASSQTKVNNAKSKAWSQSNGKNPMDGDKTVVNFGKKKEGNCAVNVGTAKPGEKAPKEIVVTTKNVINVCK